MRSHLSSYLARFAAIGLVMWTLLGCGNKASDKATREDCQKVAEHVADRIIADAAANPDALWDGLHASPGETGIPDAVDKGGFRTWITTPEGKTWMMQRRGQTLAATQQGIEQCMAKARKSDIRCLLAAKTKTDADACDKAREAAGK